MLRRNNLIELRSLIGLILRKILIHKVKTAYPVTYLPIGPCGPGSRGPIKFLNLGGLEQN